MSAAYDAIRALNWSTLKLMHTSPRLCRLRADEPREDSPALALGRAIHCAALEPARYAAEYRAQPDFGDGRTAAAKAARASWLADLPPGATVLSAADYETVRRCADALREHRVARRLLDGARAEETLTWTEPGGVACKARADLITPRYVGDLKSTRKTSLRGIEMDAASLLYHGQMAWYHFGAIAAGKLPADAEPPWMIAVQTCDAFDVACYQCSERTLAAGRHLCEELLERYLECQAANLWPGMAPDALVWEVAPWAAGTEESEHV